MEATHAYKGEDIDELSFVAGDIINVIPYENDEEQVSCCFSVNLIVARQT